MHVVCIANIYSLNSLCEAIFSSSVFLQLKAPPLGVHCDLNVQFLTGTDAASVPGFLCLSGRCRPENVSILSSLMFFSGDRANDLTLASLRLKRLCNSVQRWSPVKSRLGKVPQRRLFQSFCDTSPYGFVSLSIESHRSLCRHFLCAFCGPVYRIFVPTHHLCREDH